MVQERIRNGSPCASTTTRLFQLPLLLDNNNNNNNNSSAPSLDNFIAGIAIGSLVCLQEELESGSFYQTINFASKSLSAQVLASQSQRSNISGPALQWVHQEIGRYLADQLVDQFPHLKLIQPKLFPHVQGTTFQGVKTTDGVLILPLMRGGEPMLRGV